VSKRVRIINMEVIQKPFTPLVTRNKSNKAYKKCTIPTKTVTTRTKTKDNHHIRTKIATTNKKYKESTVVEKSAATIMMKTRKIINI
jgi:hypothetical protein